MRAAAESGDAASMAKLKAEAKRKAAARKAEAERKAAAQKAEAERKAAAQKMEAAREQMSFDAWCELGQKYGGGDVGGRQYSKAQCYTEALQINDQDHNTWFRLGFCGGGVVGEQQYSEEQCYEKTLQIHPRHRTAWFNLGVWWWWFGERTATLRASVL